MSKIWGAIIGLVLLSAGCTTNIYHVMKAESNYYIIPAGDLPGDDSDLPAGVTTFLTIHTNRFDNAQCEEQRSPRSHRTF